MIKVFTPNANEVLKSSAVHLAFRLGFQTAKPFEVSQKIGKDGEPSFSEIKDLEGKNWLTSLAISLKGDKIVLKECIISVNQQKNIVTTTLQGRNGSVKEYISDGDYQISVLAGVYSFEENQNSFEYPQDELQKLKKLLSEPETLLLQSDFLEIFGIKSVVVTGFSLEQETHSNRQSISIEMLSDEPYEIRLQSEE